MSNTGAGGTSFVPPVTLATDVPLVPGAPTHLASVTVPTAGTYFVISMFTVAQTTAQMWLGNVAGANAGVYASANSGNTAGVAVLLKLAANAVVHLNCRAAGVGRVLARPTSLNGTGSQTSIDAVLVGP